MSLPAVLLFRAIQVGLLALIPSGCETGGDSEAVDSISHPVEAVAQVPDPVVGARVSLVVPDTVARGARVPIMIRVSNTTSAPLDLYLRGRDIAFDITITDSAGAELWRRLEGETVLAIIQIKTLGPGETLELSHEWDQRTKSGRPAAAGVYGIRGSVLTDGSSSLVSNEGSLVIKP
ncbi:MAG TPA: BsuPI-related putative proteinase inhibitor [Gemmatimonadaceae bacterium]|nr:BsuPI-related putative proteinase inhibitor [Gemmatimonadaceae bacterium]